LLLLIWGVTGFVSLFGDLLPPEVPASWLRVARSPTYVLGLTGTLAIPLLAMGVLAVIAAVRAFRGRRFRYPLVGTWLTRYLQSPLDGP